MDKEHGLMCMCVKSFFVYICQSIAHRRVEQCILISRNIKTCNYV